MVELIKRKIILKKRNISFKDIFGLDRILLKIELALLWPKNYPILDFFWIIIKDDLLKKNYL